VFAVQLVAASLDSAVPVHSCRHHKLQIALIATTAFHKRSGIVAIPPLIFGWCEMRRWLDLCATDAALAFCACHHPVPVKLKTNCAEA